MVTTGTGTTNEMTAVDDDSKVVVDLPELPSVFFRPFLTESIR